MLTHGTSRRFSICRFTSTSNDFQLTPTICEFPCKNPHLLLSGCSMVYSWVTSTWRWFVADYAKITHTGRMCWRVCCQAVTKTPQSLIKEGIFCFFSSFKMVPKCLRDQESNQFSLFLFSLLKSTLFWGGGLASSLPSHPLLQHVPARETKIYGFNNTAALLRYLCPWQWRPLARPSFSVMDDETCCLYSTFAKLWANKGKNSEELHLRWHGLSPHCDTNVSAYKKKKEKHGLYFHCRAAARDQQAQLQVSLVWQTDTINNTAALLGFYFGHHTVPVLSGRHL